MKKKRLRFVVGSALLAAALIASVPAVDMFLSLWEGNLKEATDAGGYTTQQMVAGVSSETIRAILTCYLYATTEGRGSSRGHAIGHGLLYSALIASLYIILGGFYFQVKNPVKFIVQDSLILAVQGLVTGLVLYTVYKDVAGANTTQEEHFKKNVSGTVNKD